MACLLGCTLGNALGANAGRSEDGEGGLGVQMDFMGMAWKENRWRGYVCARVWMGCSWDCDV